MFQLFHTAVVSSMMQELLVTVRSAAVTVLISFI